MTDTELRQLKQNLMAQFQQMIDEDVVDAPEAHRREFDSTPWGAR